MDSPPTSRVRFLNLAGRVIAAPDEWTPAWLEVEGMRERWEMCRVFRNGFPLPLAMRLLPGRRQPVLVAEWPRSGPGRYRLQLRCGTTEVEACTALIRPRKISEEAYACMVEDLETRLPASVALGLQRAGGFAGLVLRPPGEATRVQELARLRRAVEGTEGRVGLLRILTELARNPQRGLREVGMWASRERARRPHPVRLAHALAQGQNLGPKGELLRVVDSRVEHTSDVYENRVVATFACQVELRLRLLARSMGFGQGDGVARQAGGLLASLLAARREARFLDEVQLPAALPTRLTMVLLRRPPYRAALEGYLELHRSPFVRLEDPALAAPLESVPRLYQLWGTLEIVDAALHVAEELGYRLVRQRLVCRSPGELYLRILPNGASVIGLMHPETLTRVEVIPERAYRRGSGLHSLTYEQRPDVAVEVHAPDRPPQLYLFDPKYKLDGEATEASPSRPVKMDLDKMHAYRDAIRDGFGGQPVRYAAILYPGDPERYPAGSALPDVEAIHAYPGHESQLRERLRAILRAALLVPGQQASPLDTPPD